VRVRDEFCKEYNTSTPPVIRWGLVVRDIEMGGNFPKLFAQSLANLPQVRSVTFASTSMRNVLPFVVL
jgi:hypothetical protein